MDHIHVIGTKGCGSVIAEAFLTLAKIPYDREEINYEIEGPDRDRLLKLNPLGQVPTLILQDGSILTETLAVAVYVNSKFPELKLIPTYSTELEKFWRWSVFLISSIYPTFTYGDLTTRWVSDQNGSEQLRETTDHHRNKLWMVVEAQSGTPYFLGNTFSAIDVYFAAMVHWRPREKWFEENCPKIYSIARKVSRDQRLSALFEKNFT